MAPDVSYSAQDTNSQTCDYRACFPIGTLLEEAAEARNKHSRHFRHFRKKVFCVA